MASLYCDNSSFPLKGFISVHEHVFCLPTNIQLFEALLFTNPEINVFKNQN